MALSKKDAPQVEAAPEQPESDPVEALPEEDAVQKATKAAIQADREGDKQKEAKEKAKAVKASPDAEDTPSGHALKEAAGISDDEKRSEAYQAARRAKRWS